MTSLDVAGITVRTQALLNAQGRKYTVKSDRIAAYVAFLAANPEIAATPQPLVASALKGRMDSELSAKIRNGSGYSDLKRNWDWPRGIMAVLFVQREAQAAKS